jgi:hypothetical protein
VRAAKAQVTGYGMMWLLVVLEYDLYLINWTTADFAPQIQTNK